MFSPDTEVGVTSESLADMEESCRMLGGEENGNSLLDESTERKSQVSSGDVAVVETIVSQEMLLQRALMMERKGLSTRDVFIPMLKYETPDMYSYPTYQRS